MNISWRDYERAMFNDLYYRFSHPMYTVIPNDRNVVGKYSETRRQIDVAVYEKEQMDRPFLMVECKRYKRKLNVKDVEAFIGMLDDIGADQGVLVSSIGFSKTAERRVRGTNVILYALVPEDAARLNWREIARLTFPWDETFHPAIGDAYYSFAIFNEVDKCLDSLEELPFDEWDSIVNDFLQLSNAKGAALLRTIAQLHPDHGWRYNAIRILDDRSLLDPLFHEALLESETDRETRELLQR